MCLTTKSNELLKYHAECNVDNLFVGFPIFHFLSHFAELCDKCDKSKMQRNEICKNNAKRRKEVFLLSKVLHRHSVPEH